MTSPKLRLLQICNVGDILGGTAACAWTVTRSLPDFEHAVAFPGRVTDETHVAFIDCELRPHCGRLDEAVREARPDLIVLHNISRSRLPSKPAMPTLQYLHSHIDPAPADATVACSHWLAEQAGLSETDVLYQAVPVPPRMETHDDRGLRERLVIGRICTPKAHKWPTEVVGFNRELAAQFPDVDWEFVGCPNDLQEELRDACGGRARFHGPSRKARSLLWRWDAMLYHHPTLTESFGRTCAEAMRCGCVPIVDDRGGFREQVEAGTGFLSKEATDSARAIQQLQNPDDRASRARRCRAVADERFSLSRFRRDLLAKLSTTVAASQAAARC